MILKKKRIRSLKPYKSFLSKYQNIIVGITKDKAFEHILEKIGFNKQLVNGESVLPKASTGPISEFNAEGKYIKHKDRPMETAYRTIEWHWEEWDGPYNTISRSKFVDVPYQRYPRTFVSPPSIEIKVATSSTGTTIIVGPMIKTGLENEANLIHMINLFLEIFGECQFFTEGLDSIIKTQVIRLNWRILPSGEKPWGQLKSDIEPILKQSPRGNQSVIEHRLETINHYKPDFAAIGQAGFHGYIILGFKEKNVYTLESLFYGNATYIFGEQWEELSKKTKAEILNESLQKERVIHTEGWEEKIKNILSA